MTTQITRSAIPVPSEWTSNDAGSHGRRIRVDGIADKKHAACTVLANPRHPSEEGRHIRVLLSRFRPHSTGWTQVEGGEQS